MLLLTTFHRKSAVTIKHNNFDRALKLCSFTCKSLYFYVFLARGLERVRFLKFSQKVTPFLSLCLLCFNIRVFTPTTEELCFPFFYTIFVQFQGIESNCTS